MDSKSSNDPIIPKEEEGGGGGKDMNPEEDENGECCACWEKNNERSGLVDAHFILASRSHWERIEFRSTLNGHGVLWEVMSVIF